MGGTAHALTGWTVPAGHGVAYVDGSWHFDRVCATRGHEYGTPVRERRAQKALRIGQAIQNGIAAAIAAGIVVMLLIPVVLDVVDQLPGWLP